MKAALKILIMGLTVGAFFYCKKPVPVRELSEAKNEITSAEQEHAPQYAADKYNEARNALLQAHQQLADENYDQASSSAKQASALALESRQASAPLYAAALKAEAKTALDAADEAYASELARDDFQAAQKLFSDGDELLKKADGSKSLDDYGQSIRKFTSSKEASERAKNLALSQKGDLLSSLSGARTNLKLAEEYGADKSAPGQYAGARAELEAARSDIEAGRLKSGNAHIVKAEQMAQALVSQARVARAGEIRKQAEAAVKAADTKLHRTDTPAARSNSDNAAMLNSLREHLAAAREAVNSANDNYSKQKFDDSVQDSEEAIRLAQIVQEQCDRIGSGSVAQRDANINPDQNKPNSNQNQTNTNQNTNQNNQDQALPAGWRRYTVRKIRPAESLWSIAADRAHYGNGDLWRKIFQANRDSVKNPNLIFPGQILVIPARDARLPER